MQDCRAPFDGLGLSAVVIPFGQAQVCPAHRWLTQSLSLAQPCGIPHGGHSPPQSTSDSPGPGAPSLQCAIDEGSPAAAASRVPWMSLSGCASEQAATTPPTSADAA